MFTVFLDIFFCKVSIKSLIIFLPSFLPSFGFVGASQTFQPQVPCVTVFSQPSLTRSLLLLTFSFWVLATMQTDGDIFVLVCCSLKTRTTFSSSPTHAWYRAKCSQMDGKIMERGSQELIPGMVKSYPAPALRETALSKLH